MIANTGIAARGDRFSVGGDDPRSHLVIAIERIVQAGRNDKQSHGDRQ
jgi:hypothetical protein